MSESKMLEKEVKFEFPKTNLLDQGEGIGKYKKLAKENQEELEEIQKDASQSIIPEKIKEKIFKIAKRVSAGVALSSTPFLAAACKEVPVVAEEQQEEKGEATILSEIKETTPETTQGTTPITETPTIIEDEGVTIPSIEGLRYDKESNTFFTKADNPYGLEAETKAGVFVKDAVEINDKMESSIGLRPEIIEVMQKKIMEEDKEFKYPLPFNFEEAKGMKIKEVKNERLDELGENDGDFWDNNFFLSISNIPLGTIIYSPMSTFGGEYLLWDNDRSRDDYYVLILSTDPSLLGVKLFRNNERIDGWPQISIEAIGIKPLPEGIEKNITSHEKDGSVNFFRTETKIGVPIAKVVTQEYLDWQYWDKKNIPIDITNEPSIVIDCLLFQEDSVSGDVSKLLTTGLENLLKLGEEEMFVFINPAYD